MRPKSDEIREYMDTLIDDSWNSIIGDNEDYNVNKIISNLKKNLILNDIIKFGNQDNSNTLFVLTELSEIMSIDIGMSSIFNVPIKESLHVVGCWILKRLPTSNPKQFDRIANEYTREICLTERMYKTIQCIKRIENNRGIDDKRVYTPSRTQRL